ncbi:outer membrane lipoprotein-sorting protein [Sediminitomix flava]|uniref:Outer membrane lipoprotein-sorting protein n=1 Tax=Sediminitomix flava TaxID=379075 RepID=A0A315ZG69_SEDFL|nr:outer membrane lipoprotein-sorting protein [Sediminitomix flava]PWJ44586.1 outer membrane lipoprotein-sorting protein [Sediminitomix flava]
MKRILISLLFSVFCFQAYAQDVEEIVKKSDEKNRGKTSRSIMTMKIIRPTWTREMTMKSWSLGEEFFLMYVEAPAKDKGTTSLKRNNEMWNWIPSIEKTVKISASMMGQSWMGSDFTNDDLLKQSSIVHDYHKKILGEEEIDGKTCWKIELIPTEDATVVWGKVILWVSKDLYNQRKAEYYDEDEYLVNTMTSFDIKKMDDREIPCKLVMQPADEPENRTEIYTRTAQYNVPMKESFFSQQNMKKIR